MASTGWPFLVAAGRRRDYSILLAPDFLVTALDYGVLDEVVRPTADNDPATVVEVRSHGGRRLTVVYATHLLAAADLAAPGLGVRDEHGRPLRLIYGFVSTDAWVSTPSAADLGTARDAAVQVYQRFLDDEDRVTVVPSRPFPLSSKTAARGGTDTRSAAPALVAAQATATTATTAASAATTVRLPRSAPWLAGAVLLAGLAVVAAVSGLGVGQHPPRPAPVVCTSTSAGANPDASTDVTGKATIDASPTVKANASPNVTVHASAMSAPLSSPRPSTMPSTLPACPPGRRT